MFMKWTPTKPVSIFWQIVFVFVIDVWAFLRIQKFKRYILIVVIPAVVLHLPTTLYPVDLECEPNWWLFLFVDTCQPFEIQMYGAIINGLFLLLSIYLVRKLSIQWNKQFSDSGTIK